MRVSSCISLVVYVEGEGVEERWSMRERKEHIGARRGSMHASQAAVRDEYDIQIEA